MPDLIGKRFRFFLISGVVILIGIVSLSVFGLKAGVELSSGSILTVRFEQQVSTDELKEELAELGLANAIVQTTGLGDFLIRSKLTTDEKGQLEADLEAEFGPLQELDFVFVDPIVARQTANIAGIAVAVAAVGILLYVTWAFRRMPKPFRFGTCAIIALLHDALVALGVFSIIGAILGWEVNLMFITGILAVIGYSVNNTVVIFDRIRENLLSNPKLGFEQVVNKSLLESLTRSLNTSLTTMIVVLALLLFVGADLQNFAIVLLIGVIAGTFSSLFIAPSLLVVWEKREWKRFIRWLPLSRSDG
ncbi:MAG: protein translocase subunit SecF [Dehalococcoidales bacterium]|nr:protein translocase subunit SecF [Dehalococcoidales bacterium]